VPPSLKKQDAVGDEGGYGDTGRGGDGNNAGGDTKRPGPNNTSGEDHPSQNDGNNQEGTGKRKPRNCFGKTEITTQEIATQSKPSSREGRKEKTK